MVVISVSEDVFDLRVAQVAVFHQLVELFEGVSSVSVLVRQVVHELVLAFHVSSVRELGKLECTLFCFLECDFFAV